MLFQNPGDLSSAEAKADINRRRTTLNLTVLEKGQTGKAVTKRNTDYVEMQAVKNYVSFNADVIAQRLAKSHIDWRATAAIITDSARQLVRIINDSSFYKCLYVM